MGREREEEGDRITKTVCKYGGGDVRTGGFGLITFLTSTSTLQLPLGRFSFVK